MRKRHHQHGLVYIGRYDMRLLGKVAGTAYYVIIPRRNRDNIIHTVRARHITDRHPVTDSHRIGSPYALKPELALYTARQLLTFRRKHHIMASCISDY